MEAKPICIGFRVIHPQILIDTSQFGEKYKDILHPATYKLTYQSSNKRGVYSFCMCPGGYVVNSSSETNKLCINGMSYHKRDSSTANSAIIVTVSPKDIGNNPLDGIEFQRKLESNTYKIGNGFIPITRLEDYINNKKTTYIENIDVNIKGEYTLANLNGLLPLEVENSLKESFVYFGKKIKGFDNPNTLLAATESRTSSPVKIIRDELYESNIKGLYPCGEGAGYAGGITSAAVDGIKIAEQIGKIYKPK